MRRLSVNRVRAYIGLGSNRANGEESPQQLLFSSLSALDSHPNIDVQVVSSFYASTPVGPQDQPDYVNAVAVVDTDLAPEDLLDALQSIEADYGRDRSQEQRWGQRSLDLDILLYGNQLIETPRLTIPHSQLTRRAFVLYPLLEIAPDLVLPNADKLQDVIAQFEADEKNQEQQLHKIDE